MSAPTPFPDLVLYSRPGCGLCDEARTVLVALLAQRHAQGKAAPPIVERDITTDPALERELFTTIPVVEIGARRLELATSAARLRALLADALDTPQAS